MTQPQTKPQSHDDFDATMRDLKSSLAHAIGRDLDAPAATPPPPVGPAAGAGGQLWGPSSPRVTSPLQLLATVADNARRLQHQAATIVEQLTGSPPAIRTREVHKLPSALLPAISALAHEIEQVHCDIATTLNQLKEELP
jgi:hypothetical protein